GAFRKVCWPKLKRLAKAEGIPLDTPWKKLEAEHRRLLLEGGEGFRGAIPFLQRLQQKAYKAGNRFLVKRYQVALPCGTCGGKRLRPEALQVTLAGRTIADVTAMSVDEASVYL